MVDKETGFRVIGNDVRHLFNIRTMKKTIVTFILGLIVAGCNKPGPVELQRDDADALLEVIRIAPADSNLAPSRVDSMVTLPEDQAKFAGQLQIAHVTFDAGQSGYGFIAFTRVLFEDRSLPVHSMLGRIIGYHGIDLGVVTLNGALVARRLHRIIGRLGRPDTIAGVEYSGDITMTHQAKTLYTWRATPDSIGPIATSIETPDGIVVESPRGGTIIRRDRDLPISWRGEGRIFIVISRFEAGRTRPLFMVRVRDDRHRAILPSKVVLRLLPPGTYVFTFVRANRRETDGVAGFTGAILVQAASVYNSYVELR